jgi:hypothetical protein
MLQDPRWALPDSIRDLVPPRHAAPVDESGRDEERSGHGMRAQHRIGDIEAIARAVVEGDRREASARACSGPNLARRDERESPAQQLQLAVEGLGACAQRSSGGGGADPVVAED